MAKIINVQPTDDFQMIVKYSDGLDGKISLMKMLKHNEYECIKDLVEFKKVKIDSKSGDIVWDCGATICKNALRGMLELQQEMARLGLSLHA